MYSQRSSLIIGFHGCDESVRDLLVNNKSSFKQSENDYDWLGHGMYFWENDPDRALEFASDKKTRLQINKELIKTPSVVGAVIELGFCLDLINSNNLKLLKVSYEAFVEEMNKSGYKIPENKTLKDGKDFIFRHLDCAVIETLHKKRQQKNDLPPFDSVRGVFWEGEDLYKNAGFKEKNHIQICIRNQDCIKGFFIPRSDSSLLGAFR